MPERATLLPRARLAVFEAYRREAATEWIEAQGASMRPLIRPGTRMLVEFGAEPAGIGEIVLFPRGEILVAHRVVAMRRRGEATLVVTKGDGEPFRETPLEPGCVTGVVRALRLAPDGPAVTVGCAGRGARAIARISNASGCAAALGWRAARRLPDPTRAPAIAAVAALSRVVSRAGGLPVAAVAQLQSSQGRR
jgi:hypothetical protein